jgi:hypothetical protein
MLAHHGGFSSLIWGLAPLIATAVAMAAMLFVTVGIPLLIAVVIFLRTRKRQTPE